MKLDTTKIKAKKGLAVTLEPKGGKNFKCYCDIYHKLIKNFGRKLPIWSLSWLEASNNTILVFIIKRNFSVTKIHYQVTWVEVFLNGVCHSLSVAQANVNSVHRTVHVCFCLNEVNYLSWSHKLSVCMHHSQINSLHMCPWHTKLVAHFV